MSARPSASRARSAASAVAVTSIAAAAFLGWSVGRAANPAPAPESSPAQRAIVAGPARVTLPPDWSPAELSATGLKGLDPASTSAFTVSPGLRAFGLVMFGTPDLPSLIPGPLQGVLRRPPAAPEATVLAGRQAWLYPAVPTARGDGLIDITVLPTSAGVLVVACVASRSIWAAASGCGSDVQGIALESGRVLPAVELVFRLQLRLALTRLDRARSAGDVALRAALTPNAQAAASRRLAGAYRAAAQAVAPSAARVEAAGTIVALLRRTRAVYGRISQAAAAGSTRRYNAARAELRKVERRLSQALATLDGS